jgi:hypothetical protein
MSTTLTNQGVKGTHPRASFAAPHMDEEWRMTTASGAAAGAATRTPRRSSSSRRSRKKGSPRTGTTDHFERHRKQQQHYLVASLVEESGSSSAKLFQGTGPSTSTTTTTTTTDNNTSDAGKEFAITWSDCTGASFAASSESAYRLGHHLASRQDEEENENTFRTSSSRQPPRSVPSLSDQGVFRLASPTLSVFSEHQGEEGDNDEEPLLFLQNVTDQSRSLISSKVWNNRRKMTQQVDKQKKSFRKRLVSGLSSKKKDDKNDNIGEDDQPVNNVAAESQPSQPAEERSESRSESRGKEKRKPRGNDDAAQDDASTKSSRGKRKGEGFVKRMRSLSHSRSRSSSRLQDEDGERQKTIVTVTSCRSDGYYNQKAPGSTSKLPRKAPTNLKLFHELAVGIKDAYAAVGQTPVKPATEDEETGEKMSDEEFYARSVLWEFMGNIDFVSFLH